MDDKKEKFDIFPGKNLIVEGASDRTFLDTLLSGQVKNIVYTNGFNNLKNSLSIILEKATAKDKDNEEQKKLAIIIDADYPREQQGNSHGYQSRRTEITEKLEAKDYIITPDISTTNQGEVFKNKDPKIAPVGLWIMPDHFSDGMIENFWLSCIDQGVRKNLLDAHIVESIDALCADEQFKDKNVLFSSTHLAKVKFETWLNWQRKPSTNDNKHECYRRLTPACALKEGWLNPDHDNIKALTAWLTRVFQ
jgi:hypothetical protein